MPVDIDSPEGHIIRKMVPFSTMPNSIFKVICSKVVVETARSGAFLFKRGDTTKDLVYLLKGEVSLEVDKLKMEVIKAGSESARFALAHQLPRKVNGVAKGTVQFLRLNSIYITTPDLNSTKSATPAKEFEKDENQGWLSVLLMTPMLRALPPAQLAKINEQLEEMIYLEGEIIIKQGAAGEFYHLIKSGECMLTHKDASPEQTLTATKLTTWDSFGAEALIFDALRNHTVTALTDLSTLRLNKKSFLTLMAEPLLKYVDESEMHELLDKGGTLLDVRSAVEYEKKHLPQAINVPLLGLRNALKEWDKELPIVVISNQRKLSAAAAFLLVSYKFSAYVSSKTVDEMQIELSEIVIETRKPVTHSLNDDVVFMDILDDDFIIDNEIVIETRSTRATTFTDPDLLAAENANLKQQVKALQKRAEKAELEKQEITQKFQALFKQAERLKAMLAALQNK